MLTKMIYKYTTPYRKQKRNLIRGLIPLNWLNNSYAGCANTIDIMYMRLCIIFVVFLVIDLTKKINFKLNLKSRY